MVQRLQGMEQRQQKMMSFLAKAVHSLGFLAQFVQQQHESNRRITEGNKKRRLKEEDHNSVGPTEGQIVKYQPLMNETAKAMVSQIGKGNFNNNFDIFLISDLSTSNALDRGSSSSRTSGVTLREVPPTSGQSYFPATSGISGQGPSSVISESSMVTTTPFSTLGPLVGAQELPSVLLPQTNLAIPKISPFQEMAPESNDDTGGESYIVPETKSGAVINSASLRGNEKLPLEIKNFSTDDPEDEWDSSLLEDEIEKLPGIIDPLWAQFLVPSPQPATEVLDLT